MTKRYDRAYFDKWYRGEDKVNPDAEVRRKVTTSVALAEYFLRRALRNVLDIGCGEAAWLPHLRALRPRVRYTGLDPSEYVVRRFGRARNIQRASFSDLQTLDLGETFDLVVCSDVLHYVDERDIAPGIAAVARLCDGVAYLEVLTTEDDIIGDLDGLVQRPAAWYRRVFLRAGFMPVGPYTWLSPSRADSASALEIPR